MNIVEMDINSIIPYEHNPRNNDEAVEAVKESIKQFGFRVPIIVDKDNIIIAGHTRLKAARLLEMKKVPIIVADDLSGEQVKAFRLADNKTHEFAKWDFDKLEAQLSNIMDIDMSMFGFTNDTFDIGEFIEESEHKEKEKKPHFVTCPSCGHTFDANAVEGGE